MAEGIAGASEAASAPAGRAKGTAGAPAAPGEAAVPAAAFDRLAAFRVTFVAIFVFLFLALVSVNGVEALLDRHFRSAVEQATRVSPSQGPVVAQIQNRVSDLVQDSVWTRYLGVRVNVTVVGADGRTPLYVGGGKVVPPPPPRSLDAAMHEALRILPAISDVVVSVPPTSLLSTGIFVGYAAVLFPVLFLYYRGVARREQALVDAAVRARDVSAERARSIEHELSKVRERLDEVEPAEQSRSQAIRELEREREGLRRKLRELAQRESQLRDHASRATELEEERQALEGLLEEALEDVSQKEGEISTLQDRLKTAGRKESAGGRGRSRESERLARRLRTLYKSLEIDDRAVSDLVALRDESMKLRAEEGLKRLDEDPDTAAVRRKVGGLPPHLSIFELGFAGKGRIYYTRSERGGYRVLAVGAKNTQKQDLEYLSRLA